MNLKKKQGLKVLGLVVFSLLLAVNCAKDGTAPNANIPPNTLISNYQIALAPDSGSAYNTTIYWSGSDIDGAVFWYNWRIINANGDSLYSYMVNDSTGGIDTLNISEFQPTNTLSLTMKLEFPTFDTKYIFYVQAEDNDRALDPTPAFDTIAIEDVREFNYQPNTEIVTGPPDGAVCGLGINFQLKGTDIDGVVDTFAYMVDTDTVWTYVGSDILTGSLNLNVRNLDTGARTITFKAIDNFREEDPSPISRSVIVVDTLYPELAISVADGHKFWVPASNPVTDITIDMTATVDFYYSAIDSFKVILNGGTPQITTNPQIVLTDLAEGDYSVDVTAYDVGGHSTSTGLVSFSLNVLSSVPNRILCVNGISWDDYGSEAVDLWDAGVPWGDRQNFKTWDLFNSGAPTSGDFADSLLGAGSPLTWMLDTTYFAAVSWFWNNFSGDDVFWYDSTLQAAVISYLEMGGNVLITGRYGDYIFEGSDNVSDFADYVQYSGAVTGLDPTSAVAVDVNMSDMGTIGDQGQTATINIAHPDAIELLETGDGTPNLGWVILPNGEGGGGSVSFVGGRSYRWNLDDFKGNVDVILNHFFGIE